MYGYIYRERATSPTADEGRVTVSLPHCIYIYYLMCAHFHAHARKYSTRT